MNQANFAAAAVIRMYRAYSGLALLPQYLLFLLICLTLVWGVVGAGLFQLHSVVEKESNRDIANVSRVYAEEVDATIDMINVSLIGLREHWVRNRQDFPAILAKLTSKLEDRIIFQIAFTDARGMLVFSSVDPAAGAVDLSDRKHIRVHLDGRDDKLFISKPVQGRVSGKWTVQFTRPVYTSDGKFGGVIVASVAPAHLARVYKQLDLGKSASFMLARPDGAVLADARHTPENRLLTSTVSGPAFDRQHGSIDGRYKKASPIDGIERFVAWRYVPRYGLVVIVGQSVKDAYGAYAGQRTMYLSAGVAGSILLALLGWNIVQAARARRQSARALASAEARWKFAIEGAEDGVWDWDIGSRSATLSTRAAAILQTDGDTVSWSAEVFRENVHPDDQLRVKQTMQAHFEGRSSSYVSEHRYKARDGGWTWILSRGMVVERAQDGKPVRMVGTFSDISDRKAKDEIIVHQAQHDALTGLPNRLLLTDRLHQALIRARRESTKLAVIYFDLDKFKPVNDTYGHEVGDNLLKAVATRLRECLRSADSIARVGGDEFVVLLQHVSEEDDSATVAANILALLNTTFEVDGLQLHISGSVGIATYPTDGEDEASLLRCADRAMYQAKADGRNQVQRYRHHPPARTAVLA